MSEKGKNKENNLKKFDLQERFIDYAVRFLSWKAGTYRYSRKISRSWECWRKKNLKVYSFVIFECLAGEEKWAMKNTWILDIPCSKLDIQIYV